MMTNIFDGVRITVTSSVVDPNMFFMDQHPGFFFSIRIQVKTHFLNQKSRYFIKQGILNGIIFKNK